MKRYLAGVVTCLAMSVAILPIACMSGRDRPAPADGVDGYSTEWGARLARRTFDGQPVGSLRDELGDAVKESGRVAWGGTGNQSAYYLLADRVVVKIDLDAVDRIIGEPIVGRVKDWPEASGGYLSQAPEINP